MIGCAETFAFDHKEKRSHRRPTEQMSYTMKLTAFALVDGKAVTERGRRALDLITRATTGASLEEEFRLINKEGTRYDFQPKRRRLHDQSVAAGDDA